MVSNPEIDEFLDPFFRPADPKMQKRAAEALDSMRKAGVSPSHVLDMVISSATLPRDADGVRFLLENRDYCERYIAGVLGYA